MSKKNKIKNIFTGLSLIFGPIITYFIINSDDKIVILVSFFILVFCHVIGNTIIFLTLTNNEKYCNIANKNIENFI